MSTATDTTKSVQKKPKKDYKQELLEQIQQQYGLSSAAVMDKALKTQDKQIENYMLQGGKTATELGQTIGVDMSLLDKLMQNQGQIKATGISEQQPQQTQQQLVQSKAPSSPFGFGGMSMQDGQMVEQRPGIIGGILSTLLAGNPRVAASADLNKLLKTSEIQQNQQMGGVKELQNLMSQERLNLSQERLGLEKQMEERRVSQETRRSRQQSVDNMKYFGSSVTPEMLESNPTLNSVVTPLVKKFGITPEINENGDVTFEIPMRDELKAKALLTTGIQKKELESLAEKLPNLDRATEALKSLKETFNTAWTPQSIEEGDYIEGVMERIRGELAIPLESWTQVNPELHTYLSNVGAFSSLLSKGGFMEAGVLTNQDIKRVIQSLPKPGYSKERVDLAWKTVEDIFTSARKNFESKKIEFTGKGEKTQPKNEFDFSKKSTDDLKKRLQELKGGGK